MKIAILTLPSINNYGGIVQAYALQTVLKDMGHEPYMLCRKYRSTPVWKKVIIIIGRFAIRYVLRDKNLVMFPLWITKKQTDYINRHTNAFVQKYIQPQTADILSTRLMRKMVREIGFEAYIVGSDQVWRPKYSPCITDFFIGFLPASDKARRIAYAASFGVDQWEYTTRQTKKCSSLAKRFDAISVREESGIELCQKYLQADAVQLVDPTLLLNKSFYENLLPPSKSTEVGKLAVYILDKTQEKTALEKKISHHLNLKPNSLMPEKKLSRETIREIEDCVFLPVTTWLQGFRNARFVVTDSFHGCIFSIIFNKPFMVIGNAGRGMARIQSLLKQFSLENRLIKSPETLNAALMDELIDWDRINLLIQELQKQAIEFISKSLKQEK